MERERRIVPGRCGAGSRAEIWDADVWQQYLAQQESAFAEIEEEVIPGMF